MVVGNAAATGVAGRCATRFASSSLATPQSDVPGSHRSTTSARARDRSGNGAPRPRRASAHRRSPRARSRRSGKLIFSTARSRTGDRPGRPMRRDCQRTAPRPKRPDLSALLDEHRQALEPFGPPGLAAPPLEPVGDLHRRARHSRSPSRQCGRRGAPSRSLRRTEYAGRGAGRPSSAVVIGTTRQSSPASSKIAAANSAHVQSPSAATW